jgi:PIN domain nuclease of toxin-antitoxin system
LTRLLLDTHVFLWWRTDSTRLSEAVRAEIGHGDEVYVSLASAWEAAIKVTLGRLRLPEPFEVGVRDSEFDEMPIRFSHTERVAALPLHHRDPFDRMLVAQAAVEGLTLVTHDGRFEPYDIPLLFT